MKHSNEYINILEAVANQATSLTTAKNFLHGILKNYDLYMFNKYISVT